MEGADDMNLKAVFWDYPEFTDEGNLKRCINENKRKGVYLWILKRFLEYGRIVDTLYLFNIDEISERLTKLKLTPYSKKKWRRMIEVYGKFKRG